MILTPRRLLAAIAAGAALLTVFAAPAQAAAPQPATVTLTRLILDPTDRGYAGSMQVTVTWNGKEATPNLGAEFVEPIAGSFAGADTNGTISGSINGTDNRQTLTWSFMEDWQPGTTRTYTLSFRALTPAQAEPMIAVGGRFHLVESTMGQVSEEKKFSAVLRGTNGSIKNPVPYVQDTQTDITISAGSEVTLTRLADGTFEGRLPVTFTWHGDAPNFAGFVDAALPDGWFVDDFDPSAGLGCGGGGCYVAGGALFDGDVRTFAVLIAAPETAGGASGTATVRGSGRWGDNELTDVSPADNSATFAYNVAG